MLANNIIVSPGNGSFIEGTNARWTKEANLTTADIKEVFFKDVAKDDYRLTANSPAIDGGTALPWLKFDAQMHERPGGKAYDIGAFEYDSDAYEGEIIVTGLLDHYEATYPLKFYPNPVESTLYIELEDIISGTLSVAVYNLLGKICIQEEFQLKNNTIAINMEQLPTGKYIINLMRSDDRGRVIRILKK